LVRLTRAVSGAGGLGELPAGCGVLLYGPPGCGKRFLARWFAAECRSYLVSINCKRAADRLPEHLGTALEKAGAVFELEIISWELNFGLSEFYRSCDVNRM